MRIAFDFRFDTDGFFTDPSRRDALEAAASIWESHLQDDFASIPVGVEFSIANPQTGVTETIVLDSEIDDIVIFVGSQVPSNPNVLAFAGFSGVDAEGDIYRRRISSNFRDTGPVTNFEPWTGTISFNPNSNWGFGIETPEPNKIDFITVALHEIGHILGVGTAPIFTSLGAGGVFNGANALVENGGNPIPLEENLAHVQEGFLNNTVLMDPIYNGGRVLPSQLDLALLADIGYEISGFVTQGSTPPLATEAGETIFGTIVDDDIQGLGGTDILQGNRGDDVLGGGADNDNLFGQEGSDRLFGDEGDDQLQGGADNDTLNGGTGNDNLFGQAGIDTFAFAADNGEDTISDFELNTEVIQIAAGLGFATSAEVLAEIEKPFSNVSRVPLSPGNRIDIFHASQIGTPLREENFAIVPTISLDNLAVMEGNEGIIEAIVNVSLNQASSETVTVEFATADGTARASEDYLASSGTLEFSPSQISQTLSLDITGDTVEENEETFFVNLSRASNAIIADAQGQATILDDDSEPVLPDLVSTAFAAAPDHVLLGQTTLTFTIANQGEGSAEEFAVALILSDDDIIGNADDLEIDTVTISGLGSGESQTLSVDVQLPVDVLNSLALADDPANLGSGYISNSFDVVGLTIDAVNSVEELNEANNFNLGKGIDKDDVTYFPWDIDGNGIVTPADAIFVINRLGQAGTGEAALADFDGSGQITPTDAIAAINRLGYNINASVMEPLLEI